MSSGDQGQHWAEQGIDAWAKHGVEEYDERDAVDRAERGLGTTDSGAAGRDAGETAADDAEHYGSGAGSGLPVNPAEESGKIVES